MNTYTITFESNGGSSIPSQDIPFDDPIQRPEPNPTKTGMYFEDWYEDEELTTMFAFTTMPAEDITVYAAWSPREYYINFQPNNGESIDSIFHHYGDEIELPDDPVRTGYTFTGWYTDNACTELLTETTMPDNGFNLFAGWEMNEYYATLHYNGGEGDSEYEPDPIVRTSPSEIDDQFVLEEEESIVDVESGSGFYLGLTSEGRLFSWGFNHRGQLGIETIDRGEDGFEFIGPYLQTPVDITPRLDLEEEESIEMMSAGDSHIIILTSEQRIITWGYNVENQLGFTTSASYVVTPTDISDEFTLAAGETFAQVVAEASHSFVRTSAGEVYAWGNNDYGQLGNDTTENTNAPTNITFQFSLDPGETIIDVQTGSRQTLALTSNHRVFAWGDNTYGQLGDGTNDSSLTPSDITDSFPDDVEIVQLATGDAHSLAITSTGRVYAWGNNSSGQLGDESELAQDTPTEITDYFSLSSDDELASVHASGDSSFARSQNDRLYAWGENSHGQLSTGDTNERTRPVNVTSLFVLYQGESLIDHDNSSTQGIALTDEGRAFIWGEGTTDKTWISTPYNTAFTNPGSPSRTGHEFAGWYTDPDLTQEYSFSRVDQEHPKHIELYAKWNVKTYSINYYNVEENVLRITDSVAMGDEHTVALDDDGRIFVWGNNVDGQLGDGTLATERELPYETTSLFDLADDETIIDVFAGGKTSFATTSDGRVFGWGDNTHGQMLTDSGGVERAPTDITDRLDLDEGETVIMISAGEGHVIALTSADRVLTWGLNGDGQLGDGSTDDRFEPMDIALDPDRFGLQPGDEIDYVATGDYHTMALSSQGKVFVWGENGSGQIGNDTLDDAEDPVDITTKLDLASGVTMESIDGGTGFTVLLTSTDQVLTWGQNTYGQLGNDSDDDSSIPVNITSRFGLALGETIDSLVAGNHHVVATTSSNTIYTWGRNHSGQLGNNDTLDQWLPTDVTEYFSLSSGDFVHEEEEVIVSAHANGDHSASITSYGHLFVWGNNSSGQVGDNTTTDRNTGIKITSQFNLATGENIDIASTGNDHNLTVTSQGRIFVWGSNSFGTLGDGTTTNMNSPSEVTARFNLDWGEYIIDVFSGDQTSFAITSEDRIFAWGNNTYGQLGDGTTDHRDLPVEITNRFPGLNPDEVIVDIVGGAYHTLALTSDGNLFAWGRNWLGQLGDGTTDDRHSPVNINEHFSFDAGVTVESIAAGENHSVAIDSDGDVYSWGDNLFGQLGNGEQGQQTSPINITEEFAFDAEEIPIHIAAGRLHNVLTTSENRIFTWGNNGSGQLGNKSFDSSSVPIDITDNIDFAGGEEIDAVITGNSHSFIWTTQDRIIGWGNNVYGQIGNDDNENVNDPVDISDSIDLSENESITSISAGFAHTVLATDRGRIMSWGLNSNGQLGDGTAQTRRAPVEITNAFRETTSYATSLTYTYGEDVDFYEPVREGFDLTGWYLDVGLTEPADLTTMPDENITLYAKWLPGEATISFETFGGTSMSPITVPMNTFIDEPVAPYLYGHRFVSWHTEEDLSDEPFDFSSTVITEDMVLYANYEKDTFVINYDENGGYGASPDIYDFEDTVNLPTPSRDGYNFAGWYYDDGTFADEFIEDSEMPGEHLELYAKWDIHIYSVRFNKNDGVTTTDRYDIEYGQSATEVISESLMDSLTTRDNYEFLYWSYSYWDPRYYDADEHERGENNRTIYLYIGDDDMPDLDRDDHDVEFRANWIGEDKTLEFNTRGGVEISDPDDYEDVEFNTRIELPSTSREGYDFLGWYDSTDFVSEAFIGMAGEEVFMPDDTTYYARWSTIEYTITYENVEAIDNPDNPTSYDTEDLPISLEDPDKPGDTFLGWYDNPDFEGAAIDEIEAGTTEDIVLYARWESDEPEE
ncbi:MAG: InlB B-repeat-containing protein [Acholeplasmataceae bacterium]